MGKSSIYAAAMIADEVAVRDFLARDPATAAAKAVRIWLGRADLLCFSRYPASRPARSDAFVRTARALLDAGASANTGWYETIDTSVPGRSFESAIYGAAGIAQSSRV